MQINIFCAPGDHRDDFESVRSQFNEWAAAEKPDVVDVKMDVTAMTDDRNIGRYLLTLLVAYRPSPG